MTVFDRFQVVCNDDCGLLGTYRSRDEAFDAGRRHHETHPDCVEVFDVMARRGQPELWAMPSGGAMKVRDE